MSNCIKLCLFSCPGTYSIASLRVAHMFLNNRKQNVSLGFVNDIAQCLWKQNLYQGSRPVMETEDEEERN